MARRSVQALTVTGILLGLSAEVGASGGGLVVFPSTPVSPPQGYGWACAVCLLLLLAGTALALRRLGRESWARSVLRSLLIVGVFAAAFFGYGRFVYMSGAPGYGGLDWGHRVIRGWHWGARSLFVKWNVTGLGFLAVSLVAFGGARSILGSWRGRLVLLATLPTYLVSLTPFLLTGALHQGGGLASAVCGQHLAELALGVVTFARDHAGRLPTGSNMEQVCAQIRPYLVDTRSSRRHPLHACPIGSLFEAEPPSYRWNHKLSGEMLPDTMRLTEGQLIVSCPWHGRFSGAGTAWGIGDVLGPAHFYYTLHRPDETACVARIAQLGGGVLAFARKHGRTLPGGGSMEEMFPSIRPYLVEAGRGAYDAPYAHTCPFEAALEGHRASYVWNAELAGATAQQLRALERPMCLISCPYHEAPAEGTEFGLYTIDLLRGLDSRGECVFPGYGWRPDSFTE